MSIKEEEIRTAAVLGNEAVERLHEAKVAIFGIGGVGGYVAEALARAGVGALTLVDHDTVSLSNLNRQIIATHTTVGKKKVEVMRDRIHDIRPDCKVTVFDCFYLPENADGIPLEGYDYIVDAIDTVAAKTELAVRANRLGIRMICSMGTGNKCDPQALTVTDLFKTTHDPLARVMRHEMRKHGVTSLKVVCSREEPVKAVCGDDSHGRHAPGSTPFVPAAAGLLIASEVVKDLIS